METWLSPFGRIWKQNYPDGITPFKQIAQAFKPLKAAYSVERIAQEFTAYLKKTPQQFVNLHKFTATFGSWSQPEPRERKPYSQSVDEMDRNAGILP